MNSNISFIIYYLVTKVLAQNNVIKSNRTNRFNYSELNDHTMVTNSDIFPYVVAILKKSTYLSAGALIDENFVLTAADSLYLRLKPCNSDGEMGGFLRMNSTISGGNGLPKHCIEPYPTRIRESKRVLRVRLGSINNKKGGTLLPIKFYEIHPFFSDTKPEFDIALIKLAHPVRLTPSLNPIRLQRRLREVTATHFIVTAWPSATLYQDSKDLEYAIFSLLNKEHFKPASLQERSSDELQQLKSMEEIKRRRILQVSHLHPTETEKCEEEMEGLDINSTDTLMCLDAALGSDPCGRETGAPVVLNGILWGIMSSYKSEDCEMEPGPSFVSLVASNDISTWIHSMIRGHRWSRQLNIDEIMPVSEEYDDNNV